MKKQPEEKSIASLIETAQTEYRAKMRELAEKEAKSKAMVVELTVKEQRLKEKIKATQAVRLRLMKEYDELVLAKEKEQLAAVRDEEFTKADVESGKITAGQFLAMGKRDDEITTAAKEATRLELEKFSDLIRDKSTEITRDEIELHKTRNATYAAMLSPARELQQSYKRLEDSIAYQLGPLADDFLRAQSELKEAQGDLLIIETGSDSNANAYVWQGITKQEAIHLQHDAKFPKEHIADLLSQLEDVDDGARVTVTRYFSYAFRFTESPVTVRQEPETAEIIKTGD